MLQRTFPKWLGVVVGEWKRNLGLDWRLVPLLALLIGIGDLLILLANPPADETTKTILKVVMWSCVGVLGGSLFPYSAYLAYRRLAVDADPLLSLRETQKNEIERYLRLVLEYADFAVRNGRTDVNWVIFQIDSGLVFPVRITRLEVSLFIGGNRETTEGGISSNEGWVYPDKLNVLAGTRTQLPALSIPISGVAFQEAILEARRQGYIVVRLEARITLEGRQPFSLKTRNMALHIRGTTNV